MGPISLSPATTGTYAGIMIFQPAANTQTLSASGDARVGVTGTIYAPAARFSQSNDAQISVTLDVDDVTLSGDASAQFVVAAAVMETTQAVLVGELPAATANASATNRSAPAVSLPANSGPATIAALGPVPQSIVVHYEPGLLRPPTASAGLERRGGGQGSRRHMGRGGALRPVALDSIFDDRVPEFVPSLEFEVARGARARYSSAAAVAGMLSGEIGSGARPVGPIPAGPISIRASRSSARRRRLGL